MSHREYTVENTMFRLVCDGCGKETPIETAQIRHWHHGRDMIEHVGLCPSCWRQHGAEYDTWHKGFA